MKRSLLALLALGLALAPLAAQSASGDPDTWWSGPWLVLGPFPAPADLGTARATDWLAAAGGEAKSAPKAAQAAAGHTWTTAGEGAQVDFLSSAARVENAVAYAYREVDAPRAEKLALKIGSDDGISIWVNGQLVLNHEVLRALRAGDDTVTVNLAAGRNRLLFKVDQKAGDWALEAHLRSLQKESADAAAHPPWGVALAAGGVASTPDGLSWSGVVMTSPSYALAGSVDVKLQDSAGNVVVKDTVALGEPFSLAIPPSVSGLVTAVAEGRDGLKTLAPDVALVAVGNWPQMKTKLAVSARAQSKASPSGPFAAAFTFLADELDGQVNDALLSDDRDLRAAWSVQQLMDRAPKSLSQLPPGTWRLAYKSNIDGSRQPYSLYLPAGYDARKKYSLLVCLHGHSGDDFGALAMGAVTKPSDFIVVAPLGRGDLGYSSLAEQDVLDVMALVQGAWNIDPDRVYLTGSSMGGLGTWRLGQMFAGRFAAIASFAGWTGTEYLGNLKNVPTMIVHGTADTTINVSSDAEAAAWLKQSGSKVRFEPLEGVGHDAWGAFSGDRGPQALLEWLRQYRRNPWPDEVSLTTPWLRYATNAWVGIQELLQGQATGEVSAKIKDSRHISVKTKNVLAFTLDLRHPKLAKSGRLLVDVDGRPVTVDAGAQTSNVVLPPGGKAFVEKPTNAVAIRHDGGGFADLFFRPVLIVYGTKKADRAEMWKRCAVTLADWSETPSITVGTRVGALEVLPDTAVTPALMAGHNLVLLGSADENQVVAALSPQMPLQTSPAGVTVGGRGWRGGVVAVFPSPRAPQNLAAVIALPFDTATVEMRIRELALSLRSYGYASDEIAGNLFPDVLVVDAQFHPLWMGNFDRHWQNLKER